MKLWIGNPENISSGYTYVANFDEVVSLIAHYKRAMEANEVSNELFAITEISVPLADVEAYTSFFAFLAAQERPFYLNPRLD